MRRYLLDTGIAGCFIDHRRGVFERARSEALLGNWIGIAHPVLAELAYRVEGSVNRDRNFQ
jgi:tRNA(fMet)-specific endonuclease VapC